MPQLGESTKIRPGPDTWGHGAPPEVRRFLQGPQPRRKELVRAIRIFVEFIRGFRAPHFVGPCVTVFGSARFREDHPYYTLGREVGRELAPAGFTVMTGGGPGIMEAANRGARDVGGRSVGCNIELPEEQKPNPYLDRWITSQSFLRAQGHAREVLVRVHHAAGRRWYARSSRPPLSCRPARSRSS